MYHKKRVYPDDDPVIKSKQTVPLNTRILRCIDCYYVIVRLKKTGCPTLK